LTIFFADAYLFQSMGKGSGNINIPMKMGEGNAAYTYAISQLVVPMIKSFKPELIVVACGFDALGGDPCVSPHYLSVTAIERTFPFHTHLL
jgi:acetoin utilization deacetylase AcuC-like enzyme